MDFSYPPQAEAFRSELRAWLEANLDERFRSAGRPGDFSPERVALLREWNRILADAGYVAIGWPTDYGGRDAGLIEQVVWAEEMHRAGAPPTVNPIGLSNIAPAILQWGSDAQKQRFLPRMRRGEDVWCQGFSEPGAGSDLASVATRALRDGDHYRVSGQKVWNTLGDVADWCSLLVRTDPDAPKHRGISCLLLDMRMPGIEVRPLVTITGETEFHEIFLDDVRVPVDALLGPENQGWGVAMTTLNSERAGVASLHLQVRKKIAVLIAHARSLEVNGEPATHDKVLRHRLARLYLEGEYLKLLSDRALSAMVHGRAGAEASLVKWVWSEVEQHRSEVAGEILGPEALEGDWGLDRVAVRGLSLAGGTTQINKNIIAQHVLGLPRSA